jgi:hypothetical protein
MNIKLFMVHQLSHFLTFFFYVFVTGAIAVSGPGPSTTGLRVGNHMQIARQKLRPGSGYLSVRVLMDGPIRVLEIADIQNEVSF